MKLDTTKTNHYVYKITCTKPNDLRKYYIGVHSSHCIPEDDIAYMGSSKYLDKSILEIGLNNFKKEILSTWETRVEANIEESIIHQSIKVASHPEYFNMSDATGASFSTYGMVAVVDIRFDKIKLVSKDEYRNNKFLKHINEKKFIKSSTLNKVVVKTEDGFKQITKDEFYNGDLEHINKGMVTSVDINTKLKIQVSMDEYKNNDNLVGLRSNTIEIYNSNDELEYVCSSTFSKFCKDNFLPHESLKQSYQNNTKLYTHITDKRMITRITKNGNIKYFGWYAKKITNN